MAVASMMEKADQEIMAAMLIGVTVLKASPTVGSGTTPITKTTGKGGAITGTIGMNVANVTEIVVTGTAVIGTISTIPLGIMVSIGELGMVPLVTMTGETRITEEAMKATATRVLRKVLGREAVAAVARAAGSWRGRGAAAEGVRVRAPLLDPHKRRSACARPQASTVSRSLARLERSPPRQLRREVSLWRRAARQTFTA